MSSVPTTNLSQLDDAQLTAYADRVSATPELADREPRVIARWAGESPVQAHVWRHQHASPVGDTLTRPVPAPLDLDARIGWPAP